MKELDRDNSPVILLSAYINLFFSSLYKEGEKIKNNSDNPISPKKFDILFDFNPYKLLIGISLGLLFLQKIIVLAKPI